MTLGVSVIFIGFGKKTDVIAKEKKLEPANIMIFSLKLSNFRWKILHERQKCQIYELLFFFSVKAV